VPSARDAKSTRGGWWRRPRRLLVQVEWRRRVALHRWLRRLALFTLMVNAYGRHMYRHRVFQIVVGRVNVERMHKRVHWWIGQ